MPKLKKHNNTQSLLIVLCAGDTSLHYHTSSPWLAPHKSHRQYDVAVLYYGEDDAMATKYAENTVLMERMKGPKWMILRTFLKEHRALWKSYAYISFPDDDLSITPNQWNELVHTGMTYKLDVFQPAIIPPTTHTKVPPEIEKYIKHTHLMPANGFRNILRYVNFVEIMVPIFSHRALVRCVDGDTPPSENETCSHTPFKKHTTKKNYQPELTQHHVSGGSHHSRKTTRHHHHHNTNRRGRRTTTEHHTKHGIHNWTGTARDKKCTTKNGGILMDPTIRSGWGIDYVLPKSVLPCYRFDLPPTHSWNRNRDTYLFAVVDRVPIVHTKPLSVVGGKALKSSFYQKYNITPEREMRHTMNRWGNTRQFAPCTLRHVPEPVDYTYIERPVPPNTQPFPYRRSSGNRISLPPFLHSNLQRELQNISKPFIHPVKTVQWKKYYYKLGYGLHVKITHNQIHVVTDLGSFQSRNWNTIQMLHEVLRRYTVPDTELLICTDDKVRTPDEVDTSGIPILVMAKKPWQTYVTYPDHTFYGWKEAHTRDWETERDAIHTSCEARYRDVTRNCALVPKKDVAFFRGNTSTSYIRKYLANRSQAQQTKGTDPTLDVEDVRVDASTRTCSNPYEPHDQRPAAGFVSLPEHCKYKFLLHIPGHSYAARLKYLLATDSTVIYVQKRKDYEYREFWYDGLVDGKNCIVVRDPNAYDNLDRPRPDGQGRYRDADVVDNIESIVSSSRSSKHVERVCAHELVSQIEWAPYWGKLLTELRGC